MKATQFSDRINYQNITKSIPVLGFANKFYTLWTVSPVETIIRHGSAVQTQAFTYLRNVSTDLDRAIEFMNDKFGTSYIYDNNLRGTGSFKVPISGHDKKIVDATLFPYSKHYGTTIAKSIDTYYLTILANENDKDLQEHAKNARARLHSLGWAQDTDTRQWYASIEAMEKANDEKQQGERIREFLFQHHNTHGKRVELKVRSLSVRQYNYLNGYGTRTFVDTLEDESGNIYEYRGQKSYHWLNEWTIIKATIKHTSDYNTQKDITRLQRIKIQK